MKNIFSMFIYLLISTVVFAQEKATTTAPLINTVVTGRMLETTGWLQNKSGQWISGRNKIPANLEAQYKNLSDLEQYGLGENRENFVYMELRDVNLGNTPCTILIKKYKDGYYKYESVMKGWVAQNSITYYVFETAEMDKLKNLAPETLYNIKFNTLYCRTMLNISDKFSLYDIIADLQTAIKSKEKPIFKEDLMVNIRLTKGNVRFILQTAVSYTAPQDLEKYYYETTPDVFARLFKLY